MDRKEFLVSVAAAGTAVRMNGKAATSVDDKSALIIPKYLKPGDTIGITCPAGFTTMDEITPSVLQMQLWGFRVLVGEAIGKRDYSFGGTDEDRAADFQHMLDDSNIKAIMCARGGYGAVRIIDKLNFAKFQSSPKWIIGFSDITVMHAHLNHNYGIASIHSKMCNSFPKEWSRAEPIQTDTILSIKQALTGQKMKYTVAGNPMNKAGGGEGILVGGNLKMLETLAGTVSDLKTAGKILFVEDTGEYLYSIDRMFRHLKRAGKLSALKGLIIGGFKIKPDEPGEEFGKSLHDIVLDAVKEFKYPVCFDFPVGHQKNNYALKCGVSHKLIVRREESELESLENSL